MGNLGPLNEGFQEGKKDFIRRNTGCMFMCAYLCVVILIVSNDTTESMFGIG